jgi:hypothetical protein
VTPGPSVEHGPPWYEAFVLHFLGARVPRPNRHCVTGLSCCCDVTVVVTALLYMSSEVLFQCEVSWNYTASGIRKIIQFNSKCQCMSFVIVNTLKVTKNSLFRGGGGRDPCQMQPLKSQAEGKRLAINCKNILNLATESVANCGFQVPGFLKRRTWVDICTVFSSHTTAAIFMERFNGCPLRIFP